MPKPTARRVRRYGVAREKPYQYVLPVMAVKQPGQQNTLFQSCLDRSVRGNSSMIFCHAVLRHALYATLRHDTPWSLHMAQDKSMFGRGPPPWIPPPTPPARRWPRHPNAKLRSSHRYYSIPSCSYRQHSLLAAHPPGVVRCDRLARESRVRTLFVSPRTKQNHVKEPACHRASARIHAHTGEQIKRRQGLRSNPGVAVMSVSQAGDVAGRRIGMIGRYLPI